MVSLPSLVNILRGEYRIYCPHPNCGGWVDGSVAELLRRKEVVRECRGGRGISHQIVVRLLQVKAIEVVAEELVVG